MEETTKERDLDLNLDSQATNLDRERREHKTTSEERIKGGYQVRPGERICQSYRQTGLCDRGSNCIFNHPTCKFFRRGFCKDGSACKFIHAKNDEAPRMPNSMRQALSSNVKILAEFSHPKERDGAEPMPQEQRDHTEWQRYFEMGRRDAQEIGQQHRQRDITDSQRYFEMGMRNGQEIVQQHRQRESSDRQTRETLESMQEHRQRDINECKMYIEMGRRHVQEIVQQHRLRETSEGEEQRLMATTSDRKFEEREHETESSSMAAKRAELVTSLQSVTDDIAAGYKRMEERRVRGE